MIRVAIAASILLAAAPLQAAELDMAARQAVGLFQQACIAHAGDGAAQISFMEEHHVPHMSPELQQSFLHNQAGVAYDASNSNAHLAVAILGNGLCVVFSDTAVPTDLITALEAALPPVNMTVANVRTHDSDQAPLVHFHDYVLTREGQRYTMVVSSSGGPGAVKAILSIGLRNPSDDAPK